MNGIPLWNQLCLACPATSAHRVDLSKLSHLQVIISSFLKNVAEKSQKLQKILQLMASEIILLKRFLYKLAAVFSHDKSYKMLKHIQKTVSKFLETDVVSDLTSFQEQHTANSSSSKVIYVAPKPKYEYILVRLQGTVRLLAQILCLCQHYGSIMIRKMQLGHFVNITVISMSIASRIWALSLHIMHSLIDMYDSINNIYCTDGLIPTSTVSFLPENYIVPLCLSDWLKSDQTLKDINPLLKRKQGSKQTSSVKDIWQMINTDDDEREHLLELKKLVVLSNVGPNTENEADEDIVDKFQPNPTVDIGELVSREPTTSSLTNNKKRKRAKKRKRSPLEN